MDDLDLFLPIILHVTIVINACSQAVCQMAMSESMTPLSLHRSVSLAQICTFFLYRALIGRRALMHLQLWHRDLDITHHNMAMLPIFPGWLATFT